MTEARGNVHARQLTQLSAAGGKEDGKKEHEPRDDNKSASHTLLPSSDLIGNNWKGAESDAKGPQLPCRNTTGHKKASRVGPWSNGRIINQLAKALTRATPDGVAMHPSALSATCWFKLPIRALASHSNTPRTWSQTLKRSQKLWTAFLIEMAISALNG